MGAAMTVSLHLGVDDMHRVPRGPRVVAVGVVGDEAGLPKEDDVRPGTDHEEGLNKRREDMYIIHK